MNEHNTLVGIWILMIVIAVMCAFIIAMLVNFSRESWTTVEEKRKKARTNKIISD